MTDLWNVMPSQPRYNVLRCPYEDHILCSTRTAIFVIAANGTISNVTFSQPNSLTFGLAFFLGSSGAIRSKENKVVAGPIGKTGQQLCLAFFLSSGP